MATLFGREREIDRIDRLLSGAATGAGALVLLTGEPGIGKSRLAREVAARAASTGMRVLWGRCWEAGAAASYWPWIQVFRGLGAAPLEGGVALDHGADSQQQRFQLFDAATREITTSAARQPLAIFLDDLHAADLPSLLLLLFVARQVSAAPLFLLATTREVEPRLSPEMTEVLAKLGREGEVVSLSRLTRNQVAAWVAESDGSASNADDVFQVSEGNPLFVQEMLRAGAPDKNLLATDGIKAALDQLLRRLSGDARPVLEAAAVLGREFGSRQLAQLLGSDHQAVLICLQQACDLDVLDTVDRARFQFTHVLLRDRMYETLAPRRRCQLHWQAGLDSRRHGSDAATVANHLIEGADAGDPQAAGISALKAAEEALRRLAFEAAVDLAERGLAVIGPGPSRLACQLGIVCGESLIRLGQHDAGRARCVHVAGLAKTLGCTEEQGQAALSYCTDIAGNPVVHPTMSRLLEEGLAASGSGDCLLAAQLGARLAAARIPPKQDRDIEPALTLARHSLAMARRLGDDETLLYVFEYARFALTYSIPADERFDLVRETEALARSLDHRLALARVVPSYALTLLERGLRAEADAALNSAIELHGMHDYPQTRWRLPALRSGFSFFEGDLTKAERLSHESFSLAEQVASYPGLLEWAYQRIALAIARSEPGSIAVDAALVHSTISRNPWSKAVQAWMMGSCGRHDEGRALLRESLAMPQGLPNLVPEAEACVLLKDTQAASPIYELLQARFCGMQFLWAPAGGYVFGTTSRLLGELASLLGQKTAARRHYEDSIELCRRIGAKPFLALSLSALARLNAEDGLAGKTARGPDSGADVAALPRSPSSRGLCLRREGDVWAVTASSGLAFRVKHSKGLAYLGELLAHPGQDLHVLALLGVDHGGGDAGPVLDARAKAEYKTRLGALEDEVSEAEGFGDLARAARAREEIEMLATQLAGAVGLGGRDRRAASDAERARINVQRRLKDAIASIAQCDGSLGRYLAATVKTGTYCSFTPV